MQHAQATEEKADILVVDDVPDNLRLLAGILQEHDYRVRLVSHGQKAIDSARIKPPSLILLDIMMPDMDGYEVCQYLKADERTQNIPIIFISALNETFDKVKAFSIGGVDYITKPFQPEEVLARVDTHLKLYRMQQDLHVQNIQLQEEIAERKRVEGALQEANASKDAFFSIIAHDLRSPFTGLLGNIEISIQFFDQFSEEELKASLSRMRSSAESLYALLENLLTWSRLQRGVMEYAPGNLPLSELTTHIFHVFRAAAEHKQITLQYHIPDNTTVYADLNMISTVLRNLVSNALKFSHPGGSIGISASQHAEQVEITVSDAGVGITENDLQHLFHIGIKVSTLGTAGETGTGLGLLLCKDLVQQNGGRLWVESTVGKGTTVRFQLPSRPPARHSGSSPYVSDKEYETMRRSIQALSQTWQHEFRQAVTTCNFTASRPLVERIRDQNPALAHHLMTLVKHFQFDLLQNLLEDAKSGEDTS